MSEKIWQAFGMSLLALAFVFALSIAFRGFFCEKKVASYSLKSEYGGGQYSIHVHIDNGNDETIYLDRTVDLPGAINAVKELNATVK